MRAAGGRVGSRQHPPEAGYDRFRRADNMVTITLFTPSIICALTINLIYDDTVF